MRIRLRHGKPIGLPCGATLAVDCFNVRGAFPTFMLHHDGGGVRIGNWGETETEFFNFSKTSLAKYGHSSKGKAITNSINDAVGILKITSWEGKPYIVELVHTYHQWESLPMQKGIYDHVIFQAH